MRKNEKVGVICSEFSLQDRNHQHRFDGIRTKKLPIKLMMVSKLGKAIATETMKTRTRTLMTELRSMRMNGDRS